MKQEAINPMLTTEDIKATVEYYTELLDFHCDSYDEEWGRACVSRDGVNILFSVPDAQPSEEKSVFSGALFIYAEDVEDMWEKIKDRVKICYPLESFSYGKREFGIYDNNGYLLKFGQAV